MTAARSGSGPAVRERREPAIVQEHTFDFVVDGTPEEVWDIRWRRMRAGFTSDTVTIEVLHPGDEDGNGLVRHCRFPVPRYLLSGGRAQSWEWITEARRPVSWRYDAVGKPLWSRASGGTRLEDLGGGRTRVHFRETYEVFNPVMRRAPRAPGARRHLQGQRQAHRGLPRAVAGGAARGRSPTRPEADGRGPARVPQEVGPSGRGRNGSVRPGSGSRGRPSTRSPMMFRCT